VKKPASLADSRKLNALQRASGPANVGMQIAWSRALLLPEWDHLEQSGGTYE
jgi:hypothetical protein